ncbi:MAG: class I SAM-dependent methyltransferase [Deltaproteobacteria bacterium]
MKTTYLDLGCGKNKFPESVGVDLYAGSDADVICDLNRIHLPFRDDTFEYVVSKQVFEHVEDVERLLTDVRRVAKKGALVRIEVPHFSCFYSYGDPTHKRSFSVFALDKIAARLGYTIVKKEIKFHRAFRQFLIHRLANRFPAAYERFWAFMLPAEHVYFDLKVGK